ncbi:MAG: DUF445 family protein [Bacteroidetes bacterium]|nr:DUF445 family protein [Bacteroidota bacterium]
MREFFQNNPEVWFYLIIPVSAGLIGWITNVLALKMTFHPLNFVGITFSIRQKRSKPGKLRLGWQGIIPANAGKMAEKAVDLITGKLIDVKKVFSRIEPKRVADEMQPMLKFMIEDIVDKTMSEQIPVIWSIFPQSTKESIYEQAEKEFPQTIEELMKDIKIRITEFLNVKAMCISQLTNNRQILNDIFLKCGEKEFKFIERSGFYFGFLFGLIQMVIWFFFNSWQYAWIILPIGGLIVGYLTNVLALRMIFKPEKPRRIGFYKVQGLFIKRQPEVSVEYAKIVAGKILTPKNIFESILNGEASHRLFSIVQRHVNHAIDKTAGLNKSLIKITSGTRKYEAIKNKATDRIMQELPNSVKEIFDYAEEALDLENTLRTSMAALSPEEFVDVLHPVFEEDEWKLILTGAVLGMIAGFIQLFFLA